MTRYLILGAGPAGLACATRLRQIVKPADSVIVLEKEATAGGLCRSAKVDGAPLDIGGGHFLDTRRPRVNKFLFEFMPEEEWNLFDRKTTLHVNGSIIGQPIEANIWQMPIGDQIEYLKSIAVAGCNLGHPMPERFVDWIYWKLGARIAEDYMLPYNQKMFGNDLDVLGTYWLEKLPDVSFEDTLRSCLEKCAYGKDPGHTQFYYPKHYGYGELWLRMADELGNSVVYETIVRGIDFIRGEVMIDDGESVRADVIITTIPWVEFDELTGMPEYVRSCIGELRDNSIQVEYRPERLDTDSHWVYYPDLDLPFHRILVRHNFCPGSRGYWTEGNASHAVYDISSGGCSYSYLNQHAYPLNTIGKPEAMEKLLAWCRTRDVHGLGRWGEHCHFNSDVVVERAIALAEEVAR